MCIFIYRFVSRSAFAQQDWVWEALGLSTGYSRTTADFVQLQLSVDLPAPASPAPPDGHQGNHQLTVHQPLFGAAFGHPANHVLLDAPTARADGRKEVCATLSIARPPQTLFDQVLYSRSADAKVTYLTEFELNRAQAEGDQPIILQNERLNALKQQPQQQKKKSTYITDGGHTTDSSSSSEKAATPIVTHKRTPVEEQHYQRLTQQRSVEALTSY